MSDWNLPENFSAPQKTDIGFLYCITQLSTGKRYIGRKIFWSKKAFQKNGVKRRKTVQSDWKNYWGSGPLLQSEIERVGKEDFGRDMLLIAHSKSELSYLETYAILYSGALLKPEEYFNEWFSAKITRAHLVKVSAGLGAKISELESIIQGWSGTYPPTIQSSES